MLSAIGNEYYNKVRQYVNLRPNDIETDRFFLYYHNGKFTRQVIGKNKIREVPKTIAIFLRLPNPENFTRHCFRRTSATLLANAGANLTTLKQHGGWKSSSVAEGYIENSLHNKNAIFNKIVNSENSPPTKKHCFLKLSSSTATNLIGPNSSTATETSVFRDLDFQSFLQPNQDLNTDNVSPKQTSTSEKAENEVHEEENTSDIFEARTMCPSTLKVRNCKIDNSIINYHK